MQALEPHSWILKHNCGLQCNRWLIAHKIPNSQYCYLQLFFKTFKYLPGFLQSFSIQKALQNLNLTFNLLCQYKNTLLQGSAFSNKIQQCLLSFKWHLGKLYSPYGSCAMTVTVQGQSSCDGTICSSSVLQLEDKNVVQCFLGEGSEWLMIRMQCFMGEGTDWLREE